MSPGGRGKAWKRCSLTTSEGAGRPTRCWASSLSQDRSAIQAARPVGWARTAQNTQVPPVSRVSCHICPATKEQSVHPLECGPGQAAFHWPPSTCPSVHLLVHLSVPPTHQSPAGRPDTSVSPHHPVSLAVGRADPDPVRRPLGSWLPQVPPCRGEWGGARGTGWDQHAPQEPQGRAWG